MAPKIATVSLAEISDLFGVDTDTVHLWRQKGMPHRVASGRPRFEVAACVQWRRTQDKREHRESTSPDEAKERTRKLSADADLAELKLRERRGELVPTEDVERQTDRMVSVIRARVLSIRGRWAPRVIGLATMAEATRTLDGLVADVLAALAEGAEEIEAEDADRDSADAA
jgi:phage terminase Nu1 subunit (DNA packaging protein)